ncbi:hypothetical protein [Saccharicrinis fermentans]
MKSSGFNLEDTHLTDLERISKLLAALAIAFVWAYLAGIDKHENIKPIRIKSMKEEHIVSLNMDLLELNAL